MKNKKGFTLVELLAVIVILALIMGIAVVSIGGVLTTSREKTFRETAASLINGVRQQLYIENKVAKGTYCFDSTILEKGGTESSYGGSYNYGCQASPTASPIGGSVKKYASDLNTCGKSQKAFVNITESGGVFTYKICLTDGTHAVYATEDELLKNTAPITTPTS